jgi:probable blue pigment (indigoidine) exporter
MSHFRLVLLTALAPIFWGSTYIVTTEFLPPNRPLLVAALRALPIGLIIVAFYRKLPAQGWRLKIGGLGMLNIGIFFALLFIGAYRLPGGVAATVGAIQPFIIGILAALWLNEAYTMRKLTLGLVGLAGVGLLVLTPAAALDGIGLLAALAATTCGAFGNVMVRRWGRPPGTSLLLFTGWQLVAGGLFLLPIALIIEGGIPELSLTNILAFLYLGVINTGLAYMCWFRGLEKLPVSTAAFLGLVNPVSAVMLGFIFLNQTLNLTQLVGIGLIMFSVVIAQIGLNHQKTKPQKTALVLPKATSSADC